MIQTNLKKLTGIKQVLNLYNSSGDDPVTWGNPIRYTFNMNYRIMEWSFIGLILKIIKSQSKSVKKQILAPKILRSLHLLPGNIFKIEATNND